MLETQMTRALTLAAVLSLAAAPQEKQKPPLTFGAEVSVMAVPVFVTDKDGKTIPGLTAADFEIDDGGKVARVEGFQAIRGDADLTMPEGVGATTTLLSSRRQFVFLFDLGLSGARNIERARSAANDFYDRYVTPRDLVSVIAAQTTGFKALVGFTSDRFQVKQAIAVLGRADMSRERDPLGLLFDTNLNEYLEHPSTSTPADVGHEGSRSDPVTENRDIANRLMRAQNQAYTNQVTQFLTNFQGLGRALDAVRGRKNVILFSEGFDPAVLGGAQGQQRQNTQQSVAAGELWNVDSDSYFGSLSSQNALDTVFAALRGSDVVVHGVDIGVLGGDMMALDVQGGNNMAGGRPGDSVATFASGTGGRFIRGANNIGDALKEIADSTRDYYVLAFEPASDAPGKLRKLKIKVKRPGLKISHRPAYVVPDPKKVDLSRQGFQASEIIAKGITGGSLKISAAALPYHSIANGYGIPVVIQISPEALTDAMKRKDSGLEVFGYLVDSKGSIGDYFKATPGFDMATVGEKIKQSGLQIITTFAAKEGSYEVRLLVRDTVAGRFGSMRIPVVIPQFSSAAFISPPMVVDDPRARVALPTVTQRRPSREIPFRIDDRPFTIETDPVFKKGSAREVCLFARPSTGKTPEAKISFIGASGTAHVAKIEGTHVVRDADGFDRIVFNVAADGIAPGEYTLEIETLGLTQRTSVRVQ